MCEALPSIPSTRKATLDRVSGARGDLVLTCCSSNSEEKRRVTPWMRLAKENEPPPKLRGRGKDRVSSGGGRDPRDLLCGCRGTIEFYNHFEGDMRRQTKIPKRACQDMQKASLEHSSGCRSLTPCPLWEIFLLSTAFFPSGEGQPGGGEVYGSPQHPQPRPVIVQHPNRTHSSKSFFQLLRTKSQTRGCPATLLAMLMMVEVASCLRM